jgi:predicted DNA binding CopG/RHH family protein
VPEQLLDAGLSRAKLAGMPYQRYIRMAIERALSDTK